MARGTPNGARFYLAVWALAAGCVRQPPQFEFAGCDAVQTGPICLIGDGKTSKRTLKVFLKGGLGRQGNFETDAGIPEVTPGKLGDSYILTIPPTASWLQLTAEAGGDTGRLVLRPLVKPPWIGTSYYLRHKDDPDESVRIIRKHLNSDLPPPVLAWAYGELGRSLREQRQSADAIEAMQKAIRLDQEAGLLLDEVSDAFFLAELYLEQRRSTAVEQLLSAHFDVIDQFPDRRPWLYQYQARALQLRGELQAALRALEQGESLARQVQDESAEQMLAAIRASLLVELGRPDKADKLVTRAATRMNSMPCRQGLLLELQGSMRLDVLESILGEGEFKDERSLTDLWHKWEGAAACGASAPTSALRHDARLQCILRQALEVLEAGECAQLQYLAKVELAEARLALLTGRNDDAAVAIAAAERILHDKGGLEKDPAINLLWATLKARLALSRHHPAEATALFDKLNKLSQQGDDPYAARWRAAVGRAQVLLQEKKDADAREALLTAQQLLSERARRTSVLLGRGSFLGRYAWSTRLLVEHLYKMGRIEEIWQTIRSARVLALEEFRVFSKLSTLTPEQRQKWAGVLERYYKLRQAPKPVSGPEPEADQAALLYQQRSEVEVLQEGMKVLGESLGNHEFRPPLADELMLACHPLRTGWLCLAAESDNGRVQIHPAEIPDLDPAAEPSLLAAALLGPIAPYLGRKSTLTVLSYGPLRNIAVHMLPWKGRRLDESLDVRYSLDVPGLPEAAEPQCGPALVVVPEDVESQAGLVMANPIVDRLRRAGMVPQLETQDRRYVISGKPSRSLDLILREELVRVKFAHFTSHGEYSLAENWLSQLRLSPFTTLTAGDVLALDHVPAQVALISCESGASHDPIGGQEALGLAQSFLLRGSREVLATTRVVSAQAGDIVARSVYEHWKCGHSLAAALRAALPTLQGDPRIASDLDAFRVFVR